MEILCVALGLALLKKSQPSMCDELPERFSPILAATRY